MFRSDCRFRAQKIVTWSTLKNKQNDRLSLNFRKWITMAHRKWLGLGAQRTDTRALTLTSCIRFRENYMGVFNRRGGCDYTFCWQIFCILYTSCKIVNRFSIVKKNNDTQINRTENRFELGEEYVFGKFAVIK